MIGGERSAIIRGIGQSEVGRRVGRSDLDLGGAMLLTAGQLRVRK